MLALRSLDPARQTADRRVALSFGYGALGTLVSFAVVGGASSAVLVVGVLIALAGLPWVFAFNGRWRLFDDALGRVPFWWRGERAGIWATAPFAGALITLLAVAQLGPPLIFGFIAWMAGGAAYVGLFVWLERRYEQTILLDLVVLEARFDEITITRARPRLVAASVLQAERRVDVRPADADLEVQVRAGGEAGRPDTAHA
jgi:hypothetical protein